MHGEAWTCSFSTLGIGGRTPEEANRKLTSYPASLFCEKIYRTFFYVESYHAKLCYRFDYIREGRKLYKDMNRLVAFYKGLTTWARWVNFNVDPTKTKVFFQGISPTHYE